MPNATVRADARTMPRRLFLAAGSAAAVFTALHGSADALATHPDADLFVLARRAKALGLESDAADQALDDLEDAFKGPPFPQALFVTPQDREFFMILKAKVGDAYSQKDVHVVGIAREVTVSMYEAVFDRNMEPPAGRRELVTRAVEIENASRAYNAELAAARAAVGFPAAEAKAEALRAELTAAWRELALTPAQTVEGVVAKLDAVSHCYGPRFSGRFPQEPKADDVTSLAVAELAHLRNVEA